MPATSKAGPTDPPRGEAGYTYPAVLILLVAGSIALGATSIPPASAIIRDREAELLFRGLAYRDAIASYVSAGGGGSGSLPSRLQDLVSDPRAEDVRHIRRLYDDPLPGGGWQIVQAAGGGIIGVASTAPGRPRKTAFFPAGLDSFAEAESYAGWRFVIEEPGG